MELSGKNKMCIDQLTLGSNGVPYRLKKKCPRCSAVPLEAYKVGMAQAGDTHILEESWRNPDPKGKWFIKNPTFPPGQPPNSLRRKASLASWLTGCQDTYKESI